MPIFGIRGFRLILILLASLGLALGLVACSPGSDPSSVTSETSSVISEKPSATTALVNTGASGHQSSTPANTPTPQLPTLTASPPPYTPAPQPTGFPAPISSTTALPCTSGVCIYPGHFLLSHPIKPSGNKSIDPTYRYGSTQGGLREIHHGVDIVNVEGTPVTAAAPGTVIVAGDDSIDVFSKWHNFYGNVVIIEHNFPELGEPLYTLYAHLFEIHTRVGETVQAGEQIGFVGSSGVALGNHLHFEVRRGINDYDHTQNPELWLQPNLDEQGQPHGAIAGLVINKHGILIDIPSVVITRLNSEGKIVKTYYVETYANPNIKGDDLWGENFALGNLPAGQYRVSFVILRMHVYEVEVQPGMVTMVTYDAREQ